MNNHKSEYGVIQTIRFMIRQAVKEAPAVLVWLVVDAILALITAARIIRDTGITARY